MRRGAWLAILFLACASPAAEDPPIVAIPNGGFEQGAEGWSFENDGGISAISTDKTSNGKRSLKVKDEDQKKGSSVLGQAVAVDGAGRYELRGKVCAISGAGLGLYVHRLDKDRNRLPADNENHVGAVDGIDAKWRPFACEFQAPKGTAFLQLWIHSYGGAEVEAYLDEFEFARLPPAEAKRPWPAQYKLAAEDQDKLTPADVLGPDGLVYPNWTRTGVQGGIPGVKVVAKLGDFGASPDDGQDDSAALQKAVDEVGAKGGGAILIPAGTWHLDGFVTIRHDGVVLRGEGREKTKLVFRYKVPEPGVAFFWPPPGAKAGPGTPFELHANPKDLQSLAFVAGGKTVAEWKRGTHSGNTFSWRRWGKHLLDAGLKGPLELQGVAEYKGGKRLETALNVELDPDVRDARLAPVSDAAIAFRGPGFDGEKLPLAKDGARGALEVELTSAGDLKPGDLILIDGPATERWKKLTRNKCPWGAYRRYEVRVEKVDGAKVTLEQPLRIEFPVVDGSWVQRVLPIRRGGVEDLYIEQQENLWISTVLFDFALECWARGVKIHKCGRFPIYGKHAKWCSLLDCQFDDAHFKGGGGTAYAGWEYSWDCLAENLETWKLRHAPLFQWSASGNVIRKSVFHESDGQWHSGWTNENLFEQCVVESRLGHGGYGHGLWASPPEDAAHGPNGPRNVVYNCDLTSLRDGLWMGGMNENWLILHNRFVVEKGRGVFAKTASFDHVIKGNVFVLKDPASPMVYLQSEDCLGVELRDNKLFGGNGAFAAGLAEPLVNEGNEAAPLADAPRPEPAVPSIYEWQQEHAKQRKKE